MASLSLKNVCKVYPNGFVAVKDFNLEIADQEFIIFVGPSGCGKSTTLRMIAGLEEISSGELWIGDKLVNDVEPKDRDIAMVFQNYALYPHMTVYDNMAFGLKLRKVPKADIDKAVHEAAKILDIEHLLDRKPKALSGGQRQRVAMGRAIVRSPKVFLMDEPLSNLDAKLRVQMRVEISKLHQRLQTTIIYVTHDQTEAMTLGTRIVVLKDGIIQQVDTPQNLYNTPNNIFVAGFIGSPQMNLVDAEVVGNGSSVTLKLSDTVSIALPADKSKPIIDGGYVGKTVVAGIRPEDIKDDHEKETVVSRNFIENIIDKDLEDGVYSKIVTRFPPEPNGYLHIGHAKSIILNSGLAKEYGGDFHLRFDDTNPMKEKAEFVESIMEDVRWICGDLDKEMVFFASDYFDQMYECAVKLIKKGKAFVCDLNAEQMREYRGTLKEAGKNSPYRDRSIEENLDLFERMTEEQRIAVLLPPDRLLQSLAPVKLDEEATKKFLNGMKVRTDERSIEEAKVRVYGISAEKTEFLLGVGRLTSDGVLAPDRLISFVDNDR